MQREREWRQAERTRLERQRQAFDDAERARAERLQAESEARTAEHRAREQRLAEERQRRQTAWAERRNALRDEVARLRFALSEAKYKVDVGEMDDAVRAAGEVAVYERRLATAEGEYAVHMQQLPQ